MSYRMSDGSILWSTYITGWLQSSVNDQQYVIHFFHGAVLSDSFRVHSRKWVELLQEVGHIVISTWFAFQPELKLK